MTFSIIKWSIVKDEFFYGRPCKPVLTEVCFCEEKEEGYRICDDCFTEAIAWQCWMRSNDEVLRMLEDGRYSGG